MLATPLPSGAAVRWLSGVLVLPLLVVLLGAAFTREQPPSTQVDVNVNALPPLAQQLLPTIREQLAAKCPDLPAVWVVAEVQVESNWDPNAYQPSTGAAGLLQFLPDTWVAAGGTTGWTSRPDPSHPVWDPTTHLQVATGWLCGNLTTVTEHLRATGKPTSPLQALAVCHVAGCARVTGSATGIPTAGEAGCSQACVDQVTAHLASLDSHLQSYATPVSLPAAAGANAAPFPGGGGGCSVQDPTGTGGCLTPATSWMLTQTLAAYPDIPASCWDRHAWNPRSDHPRGRACDFTIGRIGSFPPEPLVTQGWAMAEWLRANAGPLNIRYIIWQGRIWNAGSSDWRVYSGGGVYDARSATGGHYDHLHVSVAQ